jgi:hypothetical protein
VFGEARGEPLNVDEIARQVMETKGFDARDAIVRIAIRDQVGDVAKRIHRHGTVEKIGQGRASRWKLAGT